ncbi:MAG TPA: hypothetical protein VEW03_08505 [Longimicrobiaceae bacterium]|nr:hypothetical protein [Longimicrobiaceae bacterium]
MSDTSELGLGWPVCRCGTPMHPHKVHQSAGGPLERYACPKRRWWNCFLHPYAWLDPRGPDA